MLVVFRRRAPGLFSWLIRRWTRSEFSHCEVVVHGTTMISAVEGKGVRKVQIAEPFSPERWDVIHIPVSLEYEKQALEWAEGELGCKYDWWGLFMCQVFRFGRSHPHKWWCSEFCTDFVHHAGGLLPGVKPYQQSPGKLHKLLKGYFT